MTERIIRARSGWLRFDWAALWRYRDLFWLTIRRDFVARYQQTVLGPLWFVIQPIVTALIFTLVFGRRGAGTEGPAPFLFYLGGMLAWSYFSNVVGSAGNSFNTNAAVFTKVYFPRLIVPLAAVVASLVPLLIQLAVFLIVYGQSRLGSVAPAWHPNLAALLWLPWCIVQTALFGLGVSLLTSALSAKYRDLQHALPFVLQMWLFVTPVIFPVAQLGRAARAIALVNPLTPIVETIRLGFFGEGVVSAPMFAISIGLTGVCLAAGLVLFQRVERTFADTV